MHLHRNELGTSCITCVNALNTSSHFLQFSLSLLKKVVGVST